MAQEVVDNLKPLASSREVDGGYVHNTFVLAVGMVPKEGHDGYD